MTQTAESRTYLIHPAWLILAICFINLFINYGIRLGYSVVLPHMLSALHIGRRQAGDIFNAYLLAYFILSPFTGYLTDRLGARRVIPIFGVLLGSGAILVGKSSSLFGAALSFAVVGVGASAMWTPVLTVVQRWFSEKRRGLALGILSSGTGLGFAVMGSLHPLIIATWNWRYSWYIPGAAALSMVTLNALLLRSSPEEIGIHPWGDKSQAHMRKDQQGNSLGKKAQHTKFLLAPKFWIIGFSYFLVSFALYAVTTYMVDYAHNSLEFSFEKASLLAPIHGFAQVAGVLFIPFLSDYIGRKKTLILSNAVIALSTISIVCSGSSWFTLSVSVGVLGVFYGVTWPMYGACAGDYFEKGHIGRVIGAWTPFYGIGAVCAHRMAGHLRDITGAYTIPFLLAVLSALCASAILGFLRKSRNNT